MDAHKNLAYSAVATAPSPASSGTTLSVTAGHGSRFPSAPFNATVWPSGSVPIPTNAEIIRVTSKGTGDNWTIVRAQEGTSARSVIVGDQIAATITAKTLTDIENPILDGWIDDSAETWTYASATTFTVAGDLTSKYTAGTRIKLTQSATVKYFVVVGSSYGAPNTTVTVTGGDDYSIANSTISANYHSYAANPQGYPEWFGFTPTLTGFASPTIRTSRFAVHGRVCTYFFDVLATGDGTTRSMTAPIAGSNPDPDKVMDGAQIICSRDNALNGIGDAQISGSTITLHKNVAQDAWTGSASTGVWGTLIYGI